MKKVVVLRYLLISLIFVLFRPSIGYSDQEAKDIYEEKPTKIETEISKPLEFQEIYYSYFRLLNQYQYKTEEDQKEINERAKIKIFLKNKEVLSYEFYGDLICNYFDEWDDRKLFASILVIESHGKARAVSKKGARGPWQIMTFWKKVLKIPGSLHNPEVNLKYAEKVLDIHTEEANGKLWGRKGGLYRYSGKSKVYAKKIFRLMAEIERTTVSSGFLASIIAPLSRKREEGYFLNLNIFVVLYFPCHSCVGRNLLFFSKNLKYKEDSHLRGNDRKNIKIDIKYFFI